MKINVCDVCRHEGTLTETNRYLSVKKRPELRIDLCPTHMASLKKRYPKVDAEYVQYVYQMKGMDISIEDAKIIQG